MLAGLTQLRAMHPGRPWEVDLDDQSARAKKAGGHPVWWWKDVRGGRFVQYPVSSFYLPLHFIRILLTI